MLARTRIAVLPLFLVPGLCAQATDASAPKPTKNIVATATEAGSFRTLLAAAQAAGLVDALSGKGPLTVFAPSDEAFAKLGKDTISALLKPEAKTKLANILKFHVVAGELNAAKVVGSKSLEALNGETLTIDTTKGVVVGGAKVSKTDIMASNGVIHVIDSVMLPPERQDIVATALAAGSFGTLAKALTAGGLVDTLAGEGPFTVFAPNDAAFAKLDAATLGELLKPENKAKLVAVLGLHVVSGRVLAKDVVKLNSATSLGGNLTIEVKDGGVLVNGAKVLRTDVLASNGVIHVIDTVITAPAAPKAGEQAR
jgi:transforming growth factor-beta-induced protein